MMTPSTIAVTIRPNAAPMTTATARSSTLPRAMNALNSFTMAMSALLELRGGRVVDTAVEFNHLAEPCDVSVARLERADTGGGAHEDHVAGAQGEQAGQFDQDIRHVPDQVGEQALLADFAVDFQGQPEAV